jgi:hypothetical protein
MTKLLLKGAPLMLPAFHLSKKRLKTSLARTFRLALMTSVPVSTKRLRSVLRPPKKPLLNVRKSSALSASVVRLKPF